MLQKSSCCVDAIGEDTKANIKLELVNYRYFCVLSDGGTDSTVVEEELVYLLYFKNGKPTVNLSIEPAENANTEGLY